MHSNVLYKEQLNSYQEFEQSIVIALSNNDRIFYRPLPIYIQYIKIAPIFP